jgi:hypothetical protein
VKSSKISRAKTSPLIYTHEIGLCRRSFALSSAHGMTFFWHLQQLKNIKWYFFTLSRTNVVFRAVPMGSFHSINQCVNMLMWHWNWGERNVSYSNYVYTTNTNTDRFIMREKVVIVWKINLKSHLHVNIVFKCCMDINL